MAQKNKLKNKEISSWYSLIIATASMILSAIIGIISIVNNNSIARLDKEVYVPRLQYRLGQEEVGYIFMEVSNQGNVSANNVVVNIDWKPPYVSLNECSVQPPYQDVMPVQPVLANNRTYRLTVLQINGVFKVICAFEASPVDTQFISSLPNFSDLLTSTSSDSSEYRPIGTQVNISAAFVLIESDTVLMSVVAENATSAIQIGNLPPSLQFKKVIATSTPTSP